MQTKKEMYKEFTEGYRSDEVLAFHPGWNRKEIWQSFREWNKEQTTKTKKDTFIQDLFLVD